ncbi:MAG: VWA domain-containing protein [Candidatus Spechtbacterales bacterium]
MNEVIKALSRGGQIEFARPEFLVLLIFIPIVATLIFFYSRRADNSFLRAFKMRAGSFKIYVALAVTWGILLGSLSALIVGPQIVEYGPPETTPRGDYIIMVDVSRSMDARPTPDGESQMGLARQLVQKIIDETGTARFQIYGFSGLTFSLTNLTSDYESLTDAVKNSLHVGIISHEGSTLPNALAVVAKKKMSVPELANVSHVILLADGQSPSQGFGEAISLLRQANLSVISVGIGSENGWKIPLFDDNGVFTGEYAKLTNVGVFNSVLEEENLARISDGTEGQYFNYKQSEEIISYINSTLSSDYQVIQTSEVLRATDMAWLLFFPLWLSVLVLSFYRKFY